MAELAREGAAGFSDDGFPVADAHRMRQALQYQRLAGLVLALHEEDPALSGQGVMHEGAVSTTLGVAGIPSVSESTAIERDAQLPGTRTGASTSCTCPPPSRSRRSSARARHGRQITAEVTPHHLTLTDEAVRSLDPRFKMNPPLRAQRDREALIEGLRSGAIDCIATDHAPHSREEKEAPFEEAPMGVTGLETAFPVLYTDLVLPGVLGLDLVVERMSAGGAPFGLPAPTLAGARAADLCLVDLEGVLDGRGGRLREPLGELLLRGARTAGTGADDGRAGRGRLPRAGLFDPAGGRPRGDGRRAGARMKLDRSRAALVVVDVQEAFRPAVLDFEQVARNVATLVRGARILGLPTLVTEQYPKGLGRTVPEVTEHLDVTPIEKVSFSAVDADGFAGALHEAGRDQVLLCGIEAHVCVNQTAEDLIADGVEVHVAQDAVTSRTAENRALGLHKMERSGAVATSVETALFELLRRPARRSSRKCRRWSNERAYVLLEDGMRLDGEAVARPGPRSARSSSTRR